MKGSRGCFHGVSVNFQAVTAAANLLTEPSPCPGARLVRPGVQAPALFADRLISHKAVSTCVSVVPSACLPFSSPATASPMAAEGPSHLRSLSSLPPCSPKDSCQGLVVTLHLPSVSAGKVPGGTAFLLFSFFLFCFKDKIQKRLLHTGCRVHLQMRLQIGAEPFEYLCSWKAACKNCPPNPIKFCKISQL